MDKMSSRGRRRRSSAPARSFKVYGIAGKARSSRGCVGVLPHNLAYVAIVGWRRVIATARGYATERPIGSSRTLTGDVTDRHRRGVTGRRSPDAHRLTPSAGGESCPYTRTFRRRTLVQLAT